MSFSFLSMLIIAFSAILRLMVIGAIGLGDDEAHYFAYSLHPDLSYFDHPPAIGYLIKLSVSIFGHSEFAVRLPAVMLFVGTSLLLWQLARRFYGEKTAFWSVVLLNVTPVFSFLGAVLTVPDALLAFFWMAFLSTFERALSTEKPSWWYSCGVILGMGLLSKYNAILLLPGVFAVLALSPKDRRWLSRVEPYAMLVIALIIFSPVVLWNMENGWASFGFQLAHGFGHAGAGLPAFKPELLGRCIGAQAGYISPFLFIFYWAALIVGVRNWWRVRSFDKLFALSFALPTLLLFNGIASFNEILPHWPAMGYLVLVPLLAHYTGMWMNITWLKWSTFLAWGFGLFLTVLVPLQAVYKILPPEAFLSASDAAKVEDGVGKPEKVDVTNELYGWKAVGEEVARIAAKQPPGTFVLAHRHYIASQLSFYVPGTLPIYCLSDRIDAYDFWQRDLSALDGKDAIFVTDNRFVTDPSANYPFKKCGPPIHLEIYRKWRKIRVFQITVCHEFDLSKLNPAYMDTVLGKHLDKTWALRQFDWKIFRFWNRAHCSPLWDYFFGTLTWIASGPPLVLLIGILLWFKRRNVFWRELLLLILILLIGGILVQVLKRMFGRLRPPMLFGPSVKTLGLIFYNASFPSGHTQTAFGAAVYMAYRFKRFWYAYFIIATLMGISRIYVGAHFPVDVVAGAVIGSAIAVACIKYDSYLLNSRTYK